MAATQPTQPTTEQVKAQARALLGLLTALADTVHDMGEQGMPEGPAYAAYNAKGVSIETWGYLVDTLVKAGLVRRANHVLYWGGPPIKKEGVA